MNKIVFLLLLTGMLAGHSYAQHKITVKITEPNGQPLPFVTVLLKHVKDSVLIKGELSSAEGLCTFENINEGQYFIQATLMGYTSYNSANFNVTAGHGTMQLPNIVLQQSAKSLQGVTVSAQKPFIERRDGATVLNVESSLAASGGNALDILKRAPGVQIDQDDNVLLKGKAGVTIMLDGKLTYLSGEQLANLLKSLPAETISQIEIITSPSAKYDASGNSGIINIKTKKGVITGVNGTLTASYGEGIYPFYNLGGNVNWRTKTFNVYGNYNYGNRQFANNRQLLRHVINVDTPQTLDSRVFAKRRFVSNNFKAGADFYITPKQTLGVMIEGFRNTFSGVSFNHTDLSSLNNLDSVLHTVTTSRNNYNGTTYNVNYKNELDTTGKEFSVDANLVRDHFVQRMGLNDSMYYPAKPGLYDPHGVRNNTLTNITIKSIKADLILPFNKSTKLEAGLKGSFVTTDNTLDYDSLRNGKYEPAVTQSNRFRYTENVLAAYALFKKNFKHDNIQAGLRLEQTNSDGYSVTLDTRVKRSYLDFFPTLSYEHVFDDNNKAGANYSRRINRPDYDNLNPFVYYLDKYTYGQGNPYLNPEYTSNMELTYTWKQKYIANLSYAITNNVILEYLDQNDETKITTSLEKNFQHSYSYSLVLTIPIDPFKWWNITNNINTNYNSFDIKDTVVNLSSSKVAVNYQTTHTFTLPNNWKLELNAYYNSPFVWGIYHGHFQSNVGIGVQKALLNKKLTLKANVSDIFRTEQFIGTARYNTMDIYIHNRWQSRTANISVSWNFGNSEVKGAREREASDEQKRAGN